LDAEDHRILKPTLRVGADIPHLHATLAQADPAAHVAWLAVDPTGCSCAAALDACDERLTLAVLDHTLQVYQADPEQVHRATATSCSVDEVLTSISNTQHPSRASRRRQTPEVSQAIRPWLGGMTNADMHAALKPITPGDAGNEHVYDLCDLVEVPAIQSAMVTAFQERDATPQALMVTAMRLTMSDTSLRIIGQRLLADLGA